jgi:hypothetical protein
MAVRIQMRRGTTQQWTDAAGTTNAVLAAGEIGVDTTSKQLKVGDGSTTWASLPFFNSGTITEVIAGTGLTGGGTSGVVTLTVSTSGSTGLITRGTLTTKGDILVASAANTPTKLAVGTDGQMLAADSSQATGLTWVNGATIAGSETLTNKTLTSPTINGGTVSTATVTNPTVTTGTFTSPTLVTPIFTAPIESWNVVGSAPSSTQNIDVKTSSAWVYTSNATTNTVLNIRGNGSTTLNSMLSNNQSITVAVGVTNGSTPYYPTSITIDGSAVTPKWQGGTAPTAGSANSVDIYAYTIIKTATNTYTVFASQTKFA